MRAQSFFSSDPSEDLALFTRPLPTPDCLSGAVCQGFEFSSRGDRVTGRLLRPTSDEGPLPLILLQHAAGTWRSASPLDTLTARWLESGAAVASVELPLHGERASAKLSERLLGALGSDAAPAVSAPAELDPIARLLRIEFTRQAVADLQRGLDAVARISTLDSRRVAFAGFGVGATVGTLFSALDPRPAAVVLAPPADRAAPTEVAPARYVGEIAPRPLLVLDTGGTPETGAKALFDAAGEPRTLESGDAANSEALLRFLSTHLA
ncbi:MAG: hypothetical protein JRG96_02055 [Deltaproteobacteria bacterium]|nr:hypothetical protein [Deltaproteobacteria bacterium]MBW2417024.1 hypothetical protein [Deltaproteobacteria bacterium]